MDLTALRKLETDLENEVGTIQRKLGAMEKTLDSIRTTITYVGQMGLETIPHIKGFTKPNRKSRFGRGVVKGVVLEVLAKRTRPTKLMAILKLASKAMSTRKLTPENLSGHLTRMTRNGDVKRSGQYKSYAYELPNNQ